jgi:hypothetical protein
MKLNENGKPAAEQRKLDKVTETYVKIRDARSVLKRQYEAEDLDLKAQLETIEGFLLNTLQTLGADSVRTKHGTIVKGTAIKPTCMDWNAFYAWIAANEAFDALQRRVKVSFIEEYMEHNSDELPPGVTVSKEYTITVRRS